ncbi:hypothetical protein VNI00_016464 [Paramarasmius palmivorus]|uniref:Uncharacterized protein n=1 Tax=Paramarasmius palmivorus TaxID=297713 RepID=A0AAW0BCV4_9AGAR
MNDPKDQSSAAVIPDSSKGNVTLTKEVTKLNLDLEMTRHLRRTAEKRQHEAEEKLARMQDYITELEGRVEDRERENRALFTDVKIRDGELSKLRDEQRDELSRLKDQGMEAIDVDYVFQLFDSLLIHIP